MDIQPEIMEHIKDVSGCSDVYDIHRLKAYRREDGRDTEIDITIFDAGLWHPARFQVFVDSRGKKVTGQPRTDLYSAISAVPWQELSLGEPAHSS